MKLVRHDGGGTRHGKRFGRAGVALLVSVLSVTACARGGGGDDGAGTYRVAFTGALSGSVAVQVGGIRAGADAYFKSIGYKVGDTKIDFSSALDDQLDAAKTPGIIREGLATKPVAMINFSQSNGLSAAQSVLKQAGVPFFSPTISDDWLGSDVAGPVYGVSPSAYNQAMAALDFLKQQLGGSLAGKKIAIVGSVTAFVDTVVKHVKAAQATQGFTITTTELATLGTPSFSSQAFKVAQTNPDGVVQFAGGTDQVVQGKALVAAGVKVPMVGYASANTDADIKAINADNWFVTRQYNSAAAGTPMGEAAKAAGYDKEAASPFFGAGWATAALLVEGLKKCGSGCTPAKLTGVLDSISSFTPPDNAAFGPLQLSPGYRGMATAEGFFGLRGGQVTQIGTATFKPQAPPAGG